MKSESGISYDNAAVASCPKHLAPIRSRSALRRLHVGRSRCLAIHHAPEHFFPEGVRAQGLFPGPSRYRHLLRAHPAHRRDERHSGEDWLGRGGRGRIHSAGRVHGISSLQGAGDRVRHAPDPSHRIHAGAGYCARSRRARADHCRSRILGIICSGLARSARKRCRQRKISSCIKRSGTCRS